MSTTGQWPVIPAYRQDAESRLRQRRGILNVRDSVEGAAEHAVLNVIATAGAYLMTSLAIGPAN